MSSKNLNQYFFYLQAGDLFLNKKDAKINNIWKRAELNKICLVAINIEDKEDAYIDSHSEQALMRENCFKPFRKRGI
mgnify:CR=1 FL=1